VQLSETGVTAGEYPKVTVDAKGRVTDGTTLEAADIPDITLAKITDAGTAAAKNTGISVGNVAEVSATGKLPEAIIPAIEPPDSGVTAGAYTKVTVNAKGHVTDGTTLEAADIPDITLAKISDAGTSASHDVGTSTGEVPIVGADGRLPSSVLPDFPSSHKIFTPDTVDLLVTLTDAEPADEAILLDGSVYKLVKADPTVAENWKPLANEPATVKSVNGQAGPTVNITTSEVPEGSALYYTDARADARVDAKVDPIVSNVGLLKSNGTTVTTAVQGIDYLKGIKEYSILMDTMEWVDNGVGFGGRHVYTYTIDLPDVASATTGFLYVDSDANPGSPVGSEIVFSKWNPICRGAITNHKLILEALGEVNLIDEIYVSCSVKLLIID
jgi:hypothetical protein